MTHFTDTARHRYGLLLEMWSKARQHGHSSQPRQQNKDCKKDWNGQDLIVFNVKYLKKVRLFEMNHPEAERQELGLQDVNQEGQNPEKEVKECKGLFSNLCLTSADLHSAD